MVKNKKSKYSYKLLILTLKYIPVLLSILYIIYSFANYAGIALPVIFTLSKMSIIVWVFMHLATIVFQFCMYHKAFVYYAFVVNLINFLHSVCHIEFLNFNKVLLHLAIAGVILLIMLINHVTNDKKTISRYNREYRFRKF